MKKPLYKCTITELKNIAKKRKILNYLNKSKDELIDMIYKDLVVNMNIEELRNEYIRRSKLRIEKLNKADLLSLILYDKNHLNNINKDENNENHINELDKKNENQEHEVPNIKMNDIAGLDEVKNALEEKVILPLKHPEIYKKYDKSIGGGILLYGLPGTGKTMFAQATATKLNASFFNVKCSDIGSKWHGESEKNIKILFEKAHKAKQAVIFFDEFDALSKTRNEDTCHNIVQEILLQMQGLEKNKNLLLIIAATNCPWNIDSAFLRPGRFDEKIYIPLPDSEAILYILNNKLQKILDIKKYKNEIKMCAKQLVGCNGADIVHFCEKIKLSLIKLEINKTEITEQKILDIFQTLLKNTKSSVLKTDLDKLNEWRSNFR